MATKTMRGTPAARTRTIPVRKITDADLRLSLTHGLNDFLAMRGDIFFAGLIYTLIGIAAVVMTTNQPLMPFFFPVVAGVGLLGPVAAVGFYELAKRRESGQCRPQLVQLPRRLKRPSVGRHGNRCRAPAPDLPRLAARRWSALRACCSAGRRRPRSADSSRPF